MAVTEEIPKSMQAYQLTEFNKDYTIDTIPVPTIKHPHDILIRTDAASYCHTDAVLATGALRPQYPPSLPFVGCHEFAGTVVALSPHGSSSNSKSADGNHQPRFKVGDRVAVSGRGYHVCGTCSECLSSSDVDADEAGYSVYCPKSTGLGIGQDGGFQEYVLVDERQVELIPSGMTAVEAAPLMCAGLTIFSALRKCAGKGGERGRRVGIMGCGGGLGHLGLQFATKMGYKVVGVDVSPAGLELARELDLDPQATIVDASQETAEEVRAKIGKEDNEEDIDLMGLDAVIVLPESQKSFDYAMKMLKNGGTLVLVSFPREGFHLDAFEVVFRRINVVGSLIGSNRALRDMLEFCVEHDVRAKVKTYKFAELNELIGDYHAGVGGKLVVDYSK